MSMICRSWLLRSLLAIGVSGLWNTHLQAQGTGSGLSSLINSSGGTSSGGSGGSTGGASSFGGTGGGTSFGGGGSGGGGTGGGMGSGGTGGGGTGGGRTGAGGTGGGGTNLGGGASSGGADQTNFLKGSYSNPLYMGRYTNQTSTANATGGTTPNTTANMTGVGGFGQPSLGNSTSTSNRQGGTAGVSTNAGRGNTGSGITSSNQQQQSTQRISVAMSVKFPTKPVLASALQSELRDILDRSSTLTSASAIDVVVIDQVAVLRGKVADEDERRLAEGLVRLTPGIRGVKNELVAK